MDLRPQAEELLNLSREIEAAAQGEPPPPPSEKYSKWRPGAWD
jgi:hypothetical protein